jgi:hypothetical protein
VEQQLSRALEEADGEWLIVSFLKQHPHLVHAYPPQVERGANGRHTQFTSDGRRRALFAR